MHNCLLCHFLFNGTLLKFSLYAYQKIRIEVFPMLRDQDYMFKKALFDFTLEDFIT